MLRPRSFVFRQRQPRQSRTTWLTSPLALPLSLARRLASSSADTAFKSPKDLYNHLSQYIIGQERAKRILSVAVFNHYQRISHRLADPLSAPPPPPPPQSSSSRPKTSPKSDRDRVPGLASGAGEGDKEGGRYETSRWDPSRVEEVADATRVTGAEDGGDPTLTHDLRSREGRWARGDGYFSSRTSTSKPARRRGSPDDAAERERRKEDEEKEREMRQRFLDEESKVKARQELEEAIDPPKSKEEVTIEKSNVLMIGPTGTGKTLMAKTLAKALDVPFASCDATTYTQAGYVGDDVENCVLRLLQAAEYDVNRAELGIIHIDEIDKLARRGGGEAGSWGGGRDVGGEGVQQALLRLLEGTNVVLSAKPPPITSTPPSGSSAPPPQAPPAAPGSGSSGAKADRSGAETGSTPGAGGSTNGAGPFEPPSWDPNNPMSRGFGAAGGRRGVREGLPGYSGGGGPSGGKGETFVVDTSNILFILSGAFVGLDSIVQRRLGKGSIGFGAPLPTSPSLPPPRTEPLKGVSTPDLSTYGLIPEFLGRLPVLSTLQPLSLADLKRILTEPRNALLKQYIALFERYGADLRFTDDAVGAVAREGMERGGGARGLRGVLEEVLTDAMFEVPGSTVRNRSGAEYFSRGQRQAFLAAVEGDRRGVGYPGLGAGGGGGGLGLEREEEDEEEEEKVRATG